MKKFKKKFFRSIRTFFLLFLILQLLIVNSLPVLALNDTTNTWTFDASTVGDYTYDSNLVTVDASGAHPVSGVNKLTNPAFTSDNSSWSTAAVPASGWVEVPGNATYYDGGGVGYQGNFLTMQYEAKYDCTGDDDGDTAAACSAAADSGLGLDYRDLTFDNDNVVSTANGAPIVHITHEQAVSACPSGYHLITNNQWMTIVRNAKNQTANWADGTVGSLVSAGGGMYRGNVGLPDSVGYNGANPEYGTGRDSKAMLTLSNGSTIWDISGNVWHHVNFDANDNGTYNEAADLLSEQDQPEATDGTLTRTGWDWSGFTSADPVSTWYLADSGSGDLAYDDFRPIDTSLTALNGVGRIYHNSNSSNTNKNRVFLRGGYWPDGPLAGAFTLNLNWSSSSQNGCSGFRCASDPVAISQSFSSSSGRGATGGNSVTIGSVTNGKVYQDVNVGDASTYDLSAYVYDNTSGSEGGTVSSSVAQLFYNGSTISTTYTNKGSGWWELTGTLTGANESREYGLQVSTGKTIIMDDLTLSKQGEYSAYTTSAYSNSNVKNWDSFAATDTSSGNASVVYQLCTDDGSTCETGSSWQYYTGSAWATASNTTTHVNTEAELTQTAMQAFPVASTKISVKAILNFGGADTPDLDSFNIGLTTDTTAPTIALTALSPDPTTDNTPAMAGTATEDINTVSTVEFQMDSTSGSWTACTADDGAFDEISEAFTCTVSSPLSDGSHTMYVRATDDVSNTTVSGSESSDSFTVDVTAPTSIDLDSPGNNSYTNNERPSFKWKATTDATAGLSKYVLEIDNPSLGSGNPAGDFTIDDIPTSRTTDYETNKYVIHYENFSDSDTGNNYISVYTKSSNDWSSDSNSGQNDGKLREGKVSWKVKARDNVGNETSSSRTLFVDKTNPGVEFTQVNNISFSSSSFVTTDKTPTIFGKITDSLFGGDSSQTQDENGPGIASGPKQVEIKIEKKEGLIYKPNTLYTINIDKAWYTCDNKKISDNSKQKCDKYLPFEYTPKKNLAFGTYKITLTGKDKADNSAFETSFTLKVTTLAQVITPEKKEIIEEKIKELPKEEQEKVKEELEITKPVEPNIIEKTGDKVVQTSKSILTATGNITSSIFEKAEQGAKLALNTTKQTLASATQAIGSSLAFVGNAVGDGYNTVASKAPGVVRNVLIAFGEGVNNTGNTIAQGINSTKEGIANLAFVVGEKTQDVSDTAGLAIIKFTYNFVSEPTTISNVQVATISPTSVKISWQTNHPANGKVNYGLDKTYPFDIQSGKRVSLHEFVLTDLRPDTTYHFEVMSHNKDYVYDANREFITPPLEK